MAVLEYEDGVSIVRSSAIEKGGFTRRQLVITGTKGRFYVDPLEVSVNYPLQYTQYNECFEEAWGAKGVWKRSEDHDRYSTMLSSFAAMVRGEIENPYTYDYELDLFRTLIKCCE
jgi:predicted dehydrogenase